MALVRTESQAGIVALDVVLLLAIAFAGRARRLALVSVTAFLLAATFYYTVVTKPVLLETITSSQNVGARETLWRVAEQATIDHPVLGSAPETSFESRPATRWRTSTYPGSTLFCWGTSSITRTSKS